MSRRVNLILSEDTDAMLARMAAETESFSSEVVRKSITLYHYVRTAQSNGSKVLLQQSDGTIHEVILL